MRFAINRLDMSSPEKFAASAVEAERLGWDIGLQPVNPLLAHDSYICLALAARDTSRIGLGVLLDNPVLRHPSVLAGSIATVASLAPGRVQLGLGTGDTAVRVNGLQPASLATMKRTLTDVRAWLAGESIDVGALRPARLLHPAAVPVWVAAQGPGLLKLAGALANGVYLRVGTRPENLLASWQRVVEGAEVAGRDPAEIKVGLIFHTAYSEDAEQARTIAKSMAAGYYEYSPILFRRLGIEWQGPDVEELRAQVPPDFHHHRDLLASGALVDFLPDEAADAFALHGNWDQIEAQLRRVLQLDIPVDTVLPHPVLPRGSEVNFLQSCAENLLPRFR